MTYNVKVNLNELPWKNKEVRATCLSELEQLAFGTEGFMEGWKAEILPPYLHFVAQFRDRNSAFDYMNRLLDKPYVGRIAIEDAANHNRVMESKLPE